MASLHELRRLQRIYAFFKRNNGQHLPEGCVGIELLDDSIADTSEDKNYNSAVNDESVEEHCEDAANSEHYHQNSGNISDWFVQFMYKDENNNDFFVSLRISFTLPTKSIPKHSYHDEREQPLCSHSTNEMLHVNRMTANLKCQDGTTNSPLTTMPIVFVISPRLHAPFIHHGTLCALELMSQQWQLTSENVSLLLLILHHSLNPFAENSKVTIEEHTVHSCRNALAPSNQENTVKRERVNKSEENCNFDYYKENSNTTNININNNNNNKEMRISNQKSKHNANFVNYSNCYSSREHEYGIEHIHRCHPHLWRSYLNKSSITNVNELDYKIDKHTDSMNVELAHYISNNNYEEEEEQECDYLSSKHVNDTCIITVTAKSQLMSVMEHVHLTNVHQIKIIIDTEALLQEHKEQCSNKEKHLELSATGTTRMLLLPMYIPSHVEHEVQITITTRTCSGKSNLAAHESKKQELEQERTTLDDCGNNNNNNNLEETEELGLTLVNRLQNVQKTCRHCHITKMMWIRLYNVAICNSLTVEGRLTCENCTLVGSMIVLEDAHISCENTRIEINTFLLEGLHCNSVNKVVIDNDNNNNNNNDSEKEECCTEKQEEELQQEYVGEHQEEHELRSQGILLLDNAEMELLRGSIVVMRNDVQKERNTVYQLHEKQEQEQQQEQHILDALIMICNHAKWRLVDSFVTTILSKTRLNSESSNNYNSNNNNIIFRNVIYAEQSASVDLVSSTIEFDAHFQQGNAHVLTCTGLMLQSATAYLRKVKISGSAQSSSTQTFVHDTCRCNNVNNKHSTRVAVQFTETRGISAEYGAHVVLEEVLLQNCDLGMVLLEHTKVTCTRCCIQNTSTACAARSALIEFDGCSVNNIRHTALLLLNSSKCTLYDSQHQNNTENYTNRCYKALQMTSRSSSSLEYSERKENVEFEQKHKEAYQNEFSLQEEEELLEDKEEQISMLLANTVSTVTENVECSLSLWNISNCNDNNTKIKEIKSFEPNVYECHSIVAEVNHSTLIAHNVNFTNCTGDNIKASSQSVIELERCVVHQWNSHTQEEEKSRIDCSENSGSIGKKGSNDDDDDGEDKDEDEEVNNNQNNKQMNSLMEELERNDHDDYNNVTDDVFYNDANELVSNKHETCSDSSNAAGVYISHSSLKMHECSIMHSYCGIVMENGSSATCSRCGVFDGVYGVVVGLRSHAILTHCGTHHISHTGVKLIDGSHVTLNGVGHDVSVPLTAQSKPITLLSGTMSKTSHQNVISNNRTKSHPCPHSLEYYESSHQGDSNTNYHKCNLCRCYDATYTGHVQAIECISSTLHGHGICVIAGTNSGINVHGCGYYSNNKKSSNNNNSNNKCFNPQESNCFDICNAHISSNMKSGNSLILEKCRIEQARHVSCQHARCKEYGQSEQSKETTWQCKHRKMSSINRSQVDTVINNENDAMHKLFPEGVGVKMWSGARGRLSLCEVRHTQIGVLLIGPTTSASLHGSTFRHCMTALNVDGSTCTMSKCTSVNVQHVLNMSSSARAVIRRGSFHTLRSGIRACDSSTLYLQGEILIYGFDDVGIEAQSGSHIENDTNGCIHHNSKITITPSLHNETNKTRRNKTTRMSTTFIKELVLNKDNINTSNSSGSNHTWCVRVSTGGSIYLQNGIIGVNTDKRKHKREHEKNNNYQTSSEHGVETVYACCMNGVQADSYGCLTLCHCIIQCSTYPSIQQNKTNANSINSSENTNKNNNNTQEHKSKHEHHNIINQNEIKRFYSQNGKWLTMMPTCVHVCNKGNVLLMNCVVWSSNSGLALCIHDNGICRVDGTEHITLHHLQEKQQRLEHKFVNAHTKGNVLTTTSLIRGACVMKESHCTIQHTILQPMYCCTPVAPLLHTSLQYNNTEQDVSARCNEQFHSCKLLTGGAHCEIKFCELDLHVLLRQCCNTTLKEEEEEQEEFLLLWEQQQQKANWLSIFTIQGGGSNNSTFKTQLMLEQICIISEVETLQKQSAPNSMTLITSSDNAEITVYGVYADEVHCNSLSKLTVHLTSSSHLNICEHSLLSLLTLPLKEEQQKRSLEYYEEEELEKNKNTNEKPIEASELEESSREKELSSTTTRRRGKTSYFNCEEYEEEPEELSSIITCNNSTIHISLHCKTQNENASNFNYHKSNDTGEGDDYDNNNLQRWHQCTKLHEKEQTNKPKTFRPVIRLSSHSFLESESKLTSSFCNQFIVNDTRNNTIRFVHAANWQSKRTFNMFMSEAKRWLQSTSSTGSKYIINCKKSLCYYCQRTKIWLRSLTRYWTLKVSDICLPKNTMQQENLAYQNRESGHNQVDENSEALLNVTDYLLNRFTSVTSAAVLLSITIALLTCSLRLSALRQK